MMQGDGMIASCSTVPFPERGTMEHAKPDWNSQRNNHGTESLKGLALRVLERNKARNKSETAPQNPVPSHETKAPLVEKLWNKENFEERAAIIEHEAGISRAWAEAFARVCLMEKPERFSKRGWRRLIDNAGRLLDNAALLQEMERNGWSLSDVFSVHPKAPERRLDCKGLLLSLGEFPEIVSIDAKSIWLRRARSRAVMHYRKPMGATPERVMVWQMT